MFNKDQIKAIIQEIRESIRRDIEPLLRAYLDKNNWIDGHAPGFWVIPRILFPEIDGLGRLRYGETDTKGSSCWPVLFMREYFPRSEYKQVSGFIYNTYRHGLLHSHYPKEMIIHGKNRGWQINLSTHQSSIIHLKFQNYKEKTLLSLGVKDFYEDFLKALDKYVSEFDDSEKEKELIANFNTAYSVMRNPESEEISRKRPFMLDSDFDFFLS